MLVPGVQPHQREQPGVRRPDGCGAGIAAGDLVGEPEFRKRGMAHLPSPGQRERFREGVFHR